MAESVVQSLVKRRKRVVGLAFHRKVARDVVENRRIVRLHCERATVPIARFLRFAEKRQISGSHVKRSGIVRIQLEMFAGSVIATSRCAYALISLSDSVVGIRKEGQRGEIVWPNRDCTLEPLRSLLGFSLCDARTRVEIRSLE